jgi:type III pantothenate kinase
MQLLIDAGNTRIKWALAATDLVVGEWHAMGSVVHADLEKLKQIWSEHKIQRVLISNVAGEAVASQLRKILVELTVPESSLTWFRAQEQCAGVRNAYAQPTQLGSDRFASLIGARHRYVGQRLLVVTCGTATTIDALEADGTFIGGMILPGLATMATSLAVNTALLPAVDKAERARVFAENTNDAIISGCLSAQVGAIMYAYEQRTNPLARCVLSGGAAQYLGPYLPMPFDAVDNLVLLGLDASVGGVSY